MSGITFACMLSSIVSFSAAAFVFAAGHRARAFSVETMDQRYSIALILAIVGVLSFVIFVGRLTNWMHG